MAIICPNMAIICPNMAVICPDITQELRDEAARLVARAACSFNRRSTLASTEASAACRHPAVRRHTPEGNRVGGGAEGEGGGGGHVSGGDEERGAAGAWEEAWEGVGGGRGGGEASRRMFGSWSGLEPLREYFECLTGAGMELARWAYDD